MPIMLESDLQEAIKEARFYPAGHPHDQRVRLGPRESKEISRAETPDKPLSSEDLVGAQQEF